MLQHSMLNRMSVDELIKHMRDNLYALDKNLDNHPELVLDQINAIHDVNELLRERVESYLCDE